MASHQLRVQVLFLLFLLRREHNFHRNHDTCYYRKKTTIHQAMWPALKYRNVLLVRNNCLLCVFHRTEQLIISLITFFICSNLILKVSPVIYSSRLKIIPHKKQKQTLWLDLLVKSPCQIRVGWRKQIYSQNYERKACICPIEWIKYNNLSNYVTLLLSRTDSIVVCL